MGHVTRDRCHMTHDMWHVTQDRWGEVNHLSKFQLLSSYGLGVMVFWRYFGVCPIMPLSLFCSWLSLFCPWVSLFCPWLSLSCPWLSLCCPWLHLFCPSVIVLITQDDLAAALRSLSLAMFEVGARDLHGLLEIIIVTNMKKNQRCRPKRSRQLACWT